MENVNIVLLVMAVVFGSLGLCYLDTRFNLRLVDWFNGQCANPFEKANKVNSSAEIGSQADKHTIAELKQRIAVLEQIVTEPAYELNQKINQLK